MYNHLYGCLPGCTKRGNIMKYVIAFVLLTGLLFPVFSQNTNRFRTLSDSMGNSVQRNNTKLANFDEQITDNSNAKTYTTYRNRFEGLTRALNDSELRLNMLIRTNDKPAKIKDERDFFEGLVKQLETMKSDYDSWLSNVN